MEVTTQKYIRKPLYVDAVRVTAANFDDIVAWCQGEVQVDEIPGSGVTKKFIKVRVHNPKNPRQSKAFIGDWLLYTERGYKVYTNKAFHGSFDLVEEPVGEIPLAEPGSQLTDAPPPGGDMFSLESAPPADGVIEQQSKSEHGAATGADPEFEGVTQQQKSEDITDKRVLTEEEQNQMGADEVRDLVRSGEAILAQDLA
jgi:hypothetical protein